MTTERRNAFDKSAATLSLLAILAGLGVGAAARTYAAPAVPSPATVVASVQQGPAASTIVVVRRAASRPVARTRAS